MEILYVTISFEVLVAAVFAWSSRKDTQAQKSKRLLTIIGSNVLDFSCRKVSLLYAIYLFTRKQILIEEFEIMSIAYFCSGSGWKS